MVNVKKKKKSFHATCLYCSDQCAVFVLTSGASKKGNGGAFKGKADRKAVVDER